MCIESDGGELVAASYSEQRRLLPRLYTFRFRAPSAQWDPQGYCRRSLDDPLPKLPKLDTARSVVL
jgi:hypothetical protein